MPAEIEGMTFEVNDGQTVWTNATTGIVLTNSGGRQRYTLSIPERNGGSPMEAKFDFLDDAIAAYSKAWLEWAAVKIGLGFHPDTYAELYEPPLPSALAAEYDKMIRLAHRTMQNPYEIAMNAWRKAGLVQDSQP